MVRNFLEEAIFYLNKAIIYLSDINVLLKVDNHNFFRSLENFENNFNLFLERFDTNKSLFKVVFFKELDTEEVLKVFDNILKYKEVVNNFDNTNKEELLRILNDLLDNLVSLLGSLTGILNLLSNKEIKSLDLVVFDLFLSKADLTHKEYIKYLLEGLINHYELFLKIRGDILGQDLYENVLKIISFCKELTNDLDNNILSKIDEYRKKILEIDEYINEIESKASDYEYYIISKDTSLTRIPFANMWFEFIIHVYWLYENNISINTLKNLYEYRTKDTFDKAFKWYEVYINKIFNKEYLKKDFYEQIKEKISKIKEFINDLYSKVVNSYPNKIEIPNIWANLFYDILNLMNKLENEIHLRFDSKELKGSGIFEDLYDVIYRVYSEDLSMVSLYNFYFYLNGIINDLQKDNNTLLTPYDQIILNNIDLFSEFLSMIYNYFMDYENKDLLVDIWVYFDTKIKGILLNILQEYKEIEELFVIKKVVCVKCGTENEYYNEYCIKCNNKLIKPQIEAKSNLKNIFYKFKENYLNNSDYSKFLYAFINLINNSYINFDNVYKSIENLSNISEVSIILQKIEHILSILNDIKINMSTLIENDIQENEKQEILQFLENHVEELEKVLYDFDNYLASLRTNVSSI